MIAQTTANGEDYTNVLGNYVYKNQQDNYSKFYTEAIFTFGQTHAIEMGLVPSDYAASYNQYDPQNAIMFCK